RWRSDSRKPASPRRAKRRSAHRRLQRDAHEHPRCRAGFRAAERAAGAPARKPVKALLTVTAAAETATGVALAGVPLLGVLLMAGWCAGRAIKAKGEAR